MSFWMMETSSHQRDRNMLRRLSSLYCVTNRFNVALLKQTFDAFSLFTRLAHSKTNENNSSVSGEEKREQFSGDIPVDHLKIKFSRSPGPGGQNVNKVNTKVDIRFHVMTADWIPLWIRQRLQQKGVNQVNKDGELVVQSSKFRSQNKNLEDGVEKIREILKEVSHIPKETSPEKKAKISKMMKEHDQRRLLEKQYRARRKRERSKNEYP